MQPELSDITDILVNYTPLLKRTVGEQIELKFRHGENLDCIKVDKVQFLQVVLNLCVNAKDAMNKKGALTISTQKETLLEPYRFGAETIESGSFIRMDVTDSGCGIPLENMSRIFEPFFSTKQNVVGSGTGLGLATVYGIVRQMEGFIKVKSTVNVGTTFSVYLPAYPVETGSACPPPTTWHRCRKTLKIPVSCWLMTKTLSGHLPCGRSAKKATTSSVAVLLKMHSKHLKTIRISSF